MAGLAVDALGVVIEYDVPPASLPRLREQWARCLAPAGATAVVRAEHPEFDDADESDYALTSSITLAAISQLAGTMTLLHAAGVAAPDGGVLALIAASGTGKTTAARRLCSHGFGYVTDETVAIEAGGRVLPYPKPLSVVIGDNAYRKSQHGPDELGLGLPPEHLHLRRLVLLERTEQHQGPPLLEPTPMLDALIDLIPQSSAMPAMRQPLADIAALIESTGGALRLRYREIEQAADLLRSADQLPALPEPFVHLAAPQFARPETTFRVTLSPESGPTADRPLERGPYTDAIGVGDEVLVLVGSSPVRLQGIGAYIWSLARRPVSQPQLLQASRERFGDHPDAAALIEQTVAALSSYGLLQATQG